MERRKEATIEDFERLDVRVGRVERAEEFPEARRPAYKLWVDFGEGIGIRKTSAMLTALYKAEDLPGRLVLGVVNFPPRQVGKFMSEVLVLGTPNEGGDVVLVEAGEGAIVGGRLF